MLLMLNEEIETWKLFLSSLFCFIFLNLVDVLIIELPDWYSYVF